jgi:hypothetical protein
MKGLGVNKMTKVISKFRKYKLNKDIKSYSLKKGMVFEWDEMENAFITKSLPWFLTPMVTRSQMRQKIFDLLK